MSRTYRKKRPQFDLGDHLGSKKNRDGSVRDGTPTHPDASCERHGGCPYCASNRTFSNKKRQPIEDILTDDIKRMLTLAGIDT